jgi:hypothetical protein
MFGLHSGWNNRKSGLGVVPVKIFEGKFGLELGRAKWSSGEAG